MEQLLDGGNFFEGVRWHDGHWWASDLYSHKVQRITPQGEATVVATIDGQPSGSGWMPDGTMLIASMLTREIYRLTPDGELSVHAALGDLVTDDPGDLVNDMVVDATGRAYVGTFGFDLFGGKQPAPGTLVKVEPDGSASTVAEDMLFPNGLVVTPDQSTLIAAETFGARFTAFDVADDGTLSNRRVWAQPAETPPWDSFESILNIGFAPDGCAIDAEGCIWVADAINNRACRVAEGGEIVDARDGREGWGLYSVHLGGPDGSQLIACTAPSFADFERKAAQEAVLYLYDVDVPSAFAA